MKIFISWSGERSRSIAQLLHEWFPIVLHFAEPWTSNADIEAGERWASEVAKELEVSNFGIICITRENIASPWILFEAGALAKSLQNGRAIPVLLDVEFKDISGPLAQFQAKKLEKAGLNEVVVAINKLGEHPVPETRLSQLFELAWPQLEAGLGNLPKSPPGSKHNRPQHEIMEELVTGVRGLELRLRDSVEGNVPRGRKVMHPRMMEEMLHSIPIGKGDPIIYLLLGSLFRDLLPWVYELGIDTYRSALDNDRKKHGFALQRFRNSLKMIRRGPFLEESGVDRITYSLMREMEEMISEDDRIRSVPLKEKDAT